MISSPRRDILSYDTDQFRFDAIMRDLLGREDLSHVHEDPWQDGELESHIHQQFHVFQETYERFVHQVVRPLLGVDGDLCFQAVPTFRVHRPNEVAVQEFHVDTKYNHQAEVVNIWLPFTPAFDTNTVWVESVSGKKDFSPMNVGVGQFLFFHATRLNHGNLENKTRRTRLSFDARVIAVNDFRPTGKSTVSRGVPLALGGYFARMDIDGQVSQRPTRIVDPLAERRV